MQKSGPQTSEISMACRSCRVDSPSQSVLPGYPYIPTCFRPSVSVSADADASAGSALSDSVGAAAVTTGLSRSGTLVSDTDDSGACVASVRSASRFFPVGKQLSHAIFLPASRKVSDNAGADALTRRSRPQTSRAKKNRLKFGLRLPLYTTGRNRV